MSPAPGAVNALEGMALAQAMRESLWLYPAVEVVHLVGIALLFGSIAVLDLRLLGLSRSIPVRQLASHVLPWSAGSFLLIIPSGLLMFSAHAGDFLSNPVFAVKFGLIGLAGINAALFHAVTMPGVQAWDSEVMRKRGPPRAVRAAAAASLLLWVAVIACGRLLAYT